MGSAEQYKALVSSDRENTTRAPRKDSCATLLTQGHLQDILLYPSFLRASHPRLSSIPRTSVDRLSAVDASPRPLPDGPFLAASIPSTYTPPGKPASVLYLAYGSNLCAQTFLGQRGIRPLSQVNVSCPSLRLTFDLPGIPYIEPCFANTAPRKVPKTPPKLPPDIPDLPDPSKPPPNIPDVPDPRKPSLPPPPKWHTRNAHESRTQNRKGGDPVWDKGLIGVVYEVTQPDYAKIVATEGGGAGYHDIVVPCIPLPANVGVPERPPEIPIPFLAHTLYAPQIPNIPDNGDDGNGNGGHHHLPSPPSLHQSLYTTTTTTTTDEDDDDDPAKPKPPAPPDLPSLIDRLPPWAKRLFLPTNRSHSPSHTFEPYAQPSARYLDLIITGAFEHDLPADYQAYLVTLRPYTITTFSQTLAKYLTLVLLVPLFYVFVFVAQRWFVDKETGRVPVWFALGMNLWGNLIWGGYDEVGRRVFGDGERTMEEDEDGVGGSAKVGKGWGGLDGSLAKDVEKQNLLLRDW